MRGSYPPPPPLLENGNVSRHWTKHRFALLAGGLAALLVCLSERGIGPNAEVASGPPGALSAASRTRRPWAELPCVPIESASLRGDLDEGDDAGGAVSWTNCLGFDAVAAWLHPHCLMSSWYLPPRTCLAAHAVPVRHLRC